MSRPNLGTERAASHGRGGAGNINARPEPSSTSSAADLETPTIKQNTYTTGRGGSGNMAINDPANPLAARAAQDVGTPAHHTKEANGTFHWGRGGEGNMMSVGGGDRTKSKERTSSNGAAERRGSIGVMVEKGKELLGIGKKEKTSRGNEVAVE